MFDEINCFQFSSFLIEIKILELSEMENHIYEHLMSFFSKFVLNSTLIYELQKVFIREI